MGKLRININVRDGIGDGTAPNTDITIDKDTNKVSNTTRANTIARSALRVGTFALAISKSETPEEKKALIQTAAFNLAAQGITKIAFDNRVRAIETKLNKQELTIKNTEIEINELLSATGAPLSAEQAFEYDKLAERLLDEQADAIDDIAKFNKSKSKFKARTALTSAGIELGIDLITSGVHSVIQRQLLQARIGRDTKNTQFNRSLKGIRTVIEF